MPRNTGASKPPSPDSLRKVRGAGFFKETFSELKKVTWPNRQETTRLSTIVIGLAMAAGVLLWLMDFGFNEGFTRFFRAEF